jgi:hypothetical protein
MTFYDLAFFCFSHRILGVFTQAFCYIHLQIFPTNFFMIVFILCDVQVLKEKCYNTNIQSDHLTHRADNYAPHVEPSRPPKGPPHMYINT